jgi:hypothetical protein
MKKLNTLNLKIYFAHFSEPFSNFLREWLNYF